MPGEQGALVCHCRGLTLGMVRRGLAAGAASLGELRERCEAEALPPSPHTRPGGECCTARLAELFRAHGHNASTR
jgi:hypothetical protein